MAPAHIGTGIGRRLFAHVTEHLRAEGVTALRIESDPYAEGAGRTLPVLLLTLA